MRDKKKLLRIPIVLSVVVVAGAFASASGACGGKVVFDGIPDGGQGGNGGAGGASSTSAPPESIAA